MAYKVIILYQLYMPSYFLGTFTEYPFLWYQLLFICVMKSISGIVSVQMYLHHSGR